MESLSFYSPEMWHYLKLSFFCSFFSLLSPHTHFLSIMNEGMVRGWDKLRSLFLCLYLRIMNEESPRSFYGFLKIEDGIFTIVWRAPLKYEWILGKNFYCFFLLNNSFSLLPADMKLSKSCFRYEKFFHHVI